MASYVLVHGGDRDGSVWDSVANLLRKRGHQVFCPSMTSVKKSTLQDNISEIVNYIESNQLSNFILVGHSYGGFVITGVTDKLPNHVIALVYVDALIPKPEKSLHDLACDYGFDYKSFGLTEDPAVMSKIHFDAKKVFSRTKAYILCLQGEFIALTKPMYNDLKKSNTDWLFFSLDTKHGCMLTQPKELAVILSGMKLFAS